MPDVYRKHRWLDMNSPYRYRDDSLAAIGFATYEQYLRSDLWQSIRARVLAECDCCQRCGEPATQVHHRAYDPATLKGDNLNSLSPLCGKHHRQTELRPRENHEKHAKRLRSRPRRGLGMATTPKLVKP